jgi:hypothetical protein
VVLVSRTRPRKVCPLCGVVVRVNGLGRLTKHGFHRPCDGSYLWGFVSDALRPTCRKTHEAR